MRKTLLNNLKNCTSSEKNIKTKKFHLNEIKNDGVYDESAQADLDFTTKTWMDKLDLVTLKPKGNNKKHTGVILGLNEEDSIGNNATSKPSFITDNKIEIKNILSYEDKKLIYKTSFITPTIHYNEKNTKIEFLSYKGTPSEIFKNYKNIHPDIIESNLFDLKTEKLISSNKGTISEKLNKPTTEINLVDKNDVSPQIKGFIEDMQNFSDNVQKNKIVSKKNIIDFVLNKIGPTKKPLYIGVENNEITVTYENLEIMGVQGEENISKIRNKSCDTVSPQNSKNSSKNSISTDSNKQSPKKSKYDSGDDFTDFDPDDV